MAAARVPASALAFEGQGPSDDEQLLEDSDNPASSLNGLPIPSNINFSIGVYSRVQRVLDIQPVAPSPFHGQLAPPAALHRSPSRRQRAFVSL
jgi:hypothetical protein